MSRARDLARRAAAPAAIFVVCAAVYVITLGDRRGGPSPDNHFVHLAQSFLHGQLGVLGNQPPGDNDWAVYQGRWYVSFPPLPAVVIMPAVAIWGLATPDRLFWAFIAGLGPAFVYLLLRKLREEGRSGRSVRDDFLLTVLFAFGTVFYFCAVQGTVWFAAHVVAAPLLALYVLFSLDARRPWLAGLMLGLAFMARTTTLLLGVIYLVEALRMARREGAPDAAEDALVWTRLWTWLRGVDWKQAMRRLVPFAVPVIALCVVAMLYNEARFDSPFKFGHEYLQIRWRPRIEKWGLFNFHYLAKNLAVFLAALPWLSAMPPYIQISRHGLALWVTTPNLLVAPFPKKVNATIVGIFVAVGIVALMNLCYQNSGWVQFGYRFANDYMVPLIVLLALGRRRFGPGFWFFVLFAIAINTFGAVTFDRMWQFYDADGTQNVIFQPD